VARTSYFAGATPRLFAHRGLSQHREGVDENSLVAFEEAIRAGATHIESDVHATSDGVAVLFHDSDLTRVAGKSIEISSLSYAELKKIRLNYGSQIPTLDQGLELGVPLNLDIKAKGAIAPTVQAIEASRAHERVLVSSFSSARRKAALAALSSPVATSASMREVLLARTAYRASAKALGSILRGIDALQIPVAQAGVRFDSPGFISAIKQHGVEVHFWTINDPAEASRLLSLGADGIVTDRADLLF
jgi:glycerophosphoryl diester phosphodiesterase